MLPILRRLPLLLVPSLLGACAGPPSPPGESEAPIIGGSLDSNDPAVVLLASYPPDMSVFDTCTAVLVSGTVLLTAAHCVDMPNHPNYIYGVFSGADASPYPTLVDLLPHLLPVGAVYPNPEYNPNPPFDADIGVVVLASPSGITPLPFNTTPLTASIVGQAARIIGYGQTVYGTFNDTKNQASTTVASLGAVDTVVVGDATHRSCVGDSGSPAIVSFAGVPTVIGVDSYTETTGCTEPANYRRTDVYTSFIEQYTSSPDAGPPADAGPGDAGPESDGGPEMDGGSEMDASAPGDAGTGGTGAGGAGKGGAGASSSGGCAVATEGATQSGGLAAIAIALGAMVRRRRSARRGGFPWRDVEPRANSPWGCDGAA